MKTYNNIYPNIWVYENLYQSWRKAARGKRRSPDVADFEFELIDNLLKLEQELKTQTYRPGPYRHFYITQPKLRRISAAPFRDRVVHHALVGQIEPIFEPRFSRDSYACRVGKGTHAALNRCQEFARAYRYVLQCDIVQFFPAVDHAILRDILFRHIADEQTRWLIDQILGSGAGVLKEEYGMVYFPGDDLWAATRPRGLAGKAVTLRSAAGPERQRGPVPVACDVTHRPALYQKCPGLCGRLVGSGGFDAWAGAN